MGLNLLRSILGLIKRSRWKSASKCKNLIKKLKYRLLIQKNRRNAIIKQLHADIAQLLQLGYYKAALGRVEQLCNDHLILSAYDQVDKFCDCVSCNLDHISNNSNLSDDVCEAVASLIFAASRFGELPELQSIRILFRGLVGQNFERVNVELLPANRVNSQIKHNLIKKSVAEDVKILLLNEIATEVDHHLETEVKVHAQTLSKELLEANGINAQAQHQSGDLDEMLRRVGSKFCLEGYRDMVNCWSNIPDGKDKIAGFSAKANSTAIQKRHHYEDITNRVASTVSACKTEGAIYFLDSKEIKSSRREEFSRMQEPNASETCMSFKRSDKKEVTDGKCNGMIRKALKHGNVYRSQNAGDKRVVSTVSANRIEGAIPCLDNKEKQSSRGKDLRRGKELNSTKTFMILKKSNKRNITDGNCKGMIKQALKNINVYSYQDAGDVRARIYHEDKDKKINSQLAHVHPKLPDYDDLLAKFKNLKQEKMISSGIKHFAHGFGCRID